MLRGLPSIAREAGRALNLLRQRKAMLGKPIQVLRGIDCWQLVPRRAYCPARHALPRLPRRSFIQQFLTDEFQLSTTVAGVLSSCFGICNIAARPLGVGVGAGGGVGGVEGEAAPLAGAGVRGAAWLMGDREGGHVAGMGCPGRSRGTQSTPAVPSRLTRCPSSALPPARPPPQAACCRTRRPRAPACRAACTLCCCSRHWRAGPAWPSSPRPPAWEPPWPRCWAVLWRAWRPRGRSGAWYPSWAARRRWAQSRASSEPRGLWVSGHGWRVVPVRRLGAQLGAHVAGHVCEAGQAG